MLSPLSKITDRSAKICIIGQGYVGLPRAMAFAKEFVVFGYDVCSDTFGHPQAGISHIQDVKEKDLVRYLGKTYFPTSDSEGMGRISSRVERGLCIWELERRVRYRRVTGGTR